MVGTVLSSIETCANETRAQRFTADLSVLSRVCLHGSGGIACTRSQGCSSSIQLALPTGPQGHEAEDNGDGQRAGHGIEEIRQAMTLQLLPAVSHMLHAARNEMCPAASIHCHPRVWVTVDASRVPLPARVKGRCVAEGVFTLVTRGRFFLRRRQNLTQWWNFWRQHRKRPRVTQCENALSWGAWRRMQCEPAVSEHICSPHCYLEPRSGMSCQAAPGLLLLIQNFPREYIALIRSEKITFSQTCLIVSIPHNVIEFRTEFLILKSKLGEYSQCCTF